MENLISKIDADTIALIGAIAYGVLSDIIGESKETKAGSVPGLFLLALKSLFKNIASARGKKK